MTDARLSRPHSRSLLGALQRTLKRNETHHQNMDDHHQQELQRILQNRKSRGALLSTGLAASSASNLEASEPAARASLRGFGDGGIAVPRVVPTISYGSDSRSVSAVANEPAHFKQAGAAQPQPTAAAFENAFPQSMRAVPSATNFRSGSMMPQSNRTISVSSATTAGDPPVSVPAHIQTSARAPSVETLLRKGSFENFRTNPILVSTNIRPYTPVSANAASRTANPSNPPKPLESNIQSPPKQTSPRLQRDAVGAIVDSHAALTMSAVAAASFSKPNPFRSQTFEEFCEAPQYDRHQSSHTVVPQLNRQFKAPSPIAAALTTTTDGKPPLFDPQQALTVLVQGDWFLKWTRIESAHRRYVWLDLSRGVISWAKSRDSSFFMQKSVKLEDIVDLQPLCVVDDVSGRTFYQLLVTSVDRILKIGTELRDKFDVWFDTLQRLCEAQRAFTTAQASRHAAIQRLTTADEFVRHRVEAAATE